MGDVEKRKVGMLQCTKMLASIDEVSMSTCVRACMCVSVCVSGRRGREIMNVNLCNMQDCANLLLRACL